MRSYQLRHQCQHEGPGSMRANRRFELGVTALSILLSALGACIDDDPHVNPDAPLAEFRFDLPAPVPQSEQPRVLLLLDTSGSMQWREDCACTTPSCSECLPSCEAGERSRWHRVIEALTGSFTSAGCETTARTSADAGLSYDRNYAIPNVQLDGDFEQRNDGLIARFGTYVRFGLATFDSVMAYGTDELVPEAAFDWSKSRATEGMSSYAGADPERRNRARVRADGSVVGRVYYPASAGPYTIDTGIRSKAASEGALILPSADEDRVARHARINQQLLGVRPFGTSPVAAALDDVYFAFEDNHESMVRNYVVLITDGLPDDDFRSFPLPGCDCDAPDTCAGEDPSTMSCPYPLPADAARYLRCGYSDDVCNGPVAGLYVVAQAAANDALRRELDGIAAAGGSDGTRFVSGLGQLNDALDDVLTRIVLATSR
jgi:hypothetical protein